MDATVPGRDREARCRLRRRGGRRTRWRARQRERSAGQRRRSLAGALRGRSRVLRRLVVARGSSAWRHASVGTHSTTGVRDRIPCSRVGRMWRSSATCVGPIRTPWRCWRRYARTPICPMVARPTRRLRRPGALIIAPAASQRAAADALLATSAGIAVALGAIARCAADDAAAPNELLRYRAIAGCVAAVEVRRRRRTCATRPLTGSRCPPPAAAAARRHRGRLVGAAPAAGRCLAQGEKATVGHGGR